MKTTNAANWICGLMSENYDAVGFIPEPTVANRYIRNQQYVLQADERGKVIGYLLHGPVRQGEMVVVSQHCIDIEKRLRGYGEKTFQEFLNRCIRVGASSIHLRVANDLDAVSFLVQLRFLHHLIDARRYQPSTHYQRNGATSIAPLARKVKGLSMSDDNAKPHRTPQIERFRRERRNTHAAPENRFCAPMVAPVTKP